MTLGFLNRRWLPVPLRGLYQAEVGGSKPPAPTRNGARAGAVTGIAFPLQYDGPGGAELIAQERGRRYLRGSVSMNSRASRSQRASFASVFTPGAETNT